jgi:hypothetical protein
VPLTDARRSANEQEFEMKGVFALLGLLIVVVAIGFLNKKQIDTIMPTGLPPEISSDSSVPAALLNAPPQQLPEQFKKAVDEALQKSRPEEGAQ